MAAFVLLSLFSGFWSQRVLPALLSFGLLVAGLAETGRAADRYGDQQRPFRDRRFAVDVYTKVMRRDFPPSVLGLGVVAVLLLGACSAATDPRLPPAAGEFRIPEFEPGKCRFDYRASVSKVSSDGVVEWSRDIPWTGFGESQPLAVDDLIVLSTSSGVAALNLEGEAVWQSDTGRMIAVTPDGLFVFGREGLKRLIPSSGETQWEWSGTGQYGMGGPLPVTGSAVVINDAGTVRAIGQGSGKELWNVETVGEHSHPPVLGEDGNIYHAAFEGVLYAISPDDGVVLWEWRAQPGVAITNRIESNDGVVTVQTTSLLGDPGSIEPPGDAERLVAIDAATGIELWRTSLGQDEVAERGGSLVVFRRGAALEARRLADGDVQWRTEGKQIRNSDGRIQAVGDAFVVFGGRQNRVFTAYDVSDGALLWSTNLGEFSYSRGRALGGLLIIGSAADSSSFVVDQLDAGRVHALDIDTGKVVWEQTFRDAASDTIAEIDDGFIIATQDPPIFCD